MILHLQFLHIDLTARGDDSTSVMNLETLLNLTFKKVLKTSLRPAGVK